MADATLDVRRALLTKSTRAAMLTGLFSASVFALAILDSGEHVDAGFTEAQKAAIVAVCRETYYATSVVARAYAFKAVEALLDRIGE